MSHRSRRTEAGVTLIEVLVALGILSLVLIALGGLMFQVSLGTRRAAAVSYQTAAAHVAEAWMQGLPWDSLPKAVPNGAVGCVTDTVGQLIYSRCSTVADLTANLRRLTAVLTSTGNLTTRPDTLVIDRVQTSMSPFTP